MQDNNFCLAPSKYSSFIPGNNKRFGKLSDLVKLRTQRVRTENNKEYIYIEIGDLNIHTGVVDYKKYLGVNLPNSTPLSKI